MLIVRRRVGEILVIGNDVEIEILETSGTQVKLGIRAPREVSVFRKEVLLTVGENEKAAIAPTPASIQTILKLFPPA